jgi:Holliday junction resolvase RusA-like endonuclease
MKIELTIDPVAKPRMTRSDKWKHRPIVDRYFAFKDAIVGLCNLNKYKLADKYKVTFIVKMPDNWSKWKKIDMNGKPHQQKPDLDNFIKSLNDCLKNEDKTIYWIEACKYWGEEGKIIIEEVT